MEIAPRSVMLDTQGMLYSAVRNRHIDSKTEDLCGRECKTILGAEDLLHLRW